MSTQAAGTPTGTPTTESGTGELLTREAILAAKDIQYETIEVPEWGGRVRVKALTGTERDEFEGSLLRLRKQRGQKRIGRDEEVDGQDVDFRNMRAKLVAKSVVGPSGAKLFSESDIELLGQKSAAALTRVYEAAQRLSKLTAEDVEELVGNSNGTPPADM